MMANSRKHIPVDEIFAVCDEHLSGDELQQRSKVKTQIENFEKRAKLNFNKSYPAPQPPGTQVHLPKIGNYKPKILLSQTSREEKKPTENKNLSPDVDINLSFSRPLQEIKIEDSSGKTYENNDVKSEKKSYVLMGGSEAPYVIRQDSKSEDNKEKEDFFAGDESHKFSTNPLFDPAENDNTQNEQNLENVINFGESVQNPLFDDEYQTIDEATSPHSPRSPRSPNSERSFEYPPKSPNHHVHDQSFDYPPKSPGNPVAPPRYRKKSQSQKRHAPPPPPVIAEISIVDKSVDDDLPYIPPPDYDEDEITMEFNDEEKMGFEGKIFSEYEGEDFAKYLSDDEDYEFDTYTWRKNIRYRQKRGPKRPAPPRPKSDINYSQNKPTKTGALKPIGKPKHEQKVQSVSRSTIRDFSFADSKLSADRSVRSTSALGRFAKRGKERPRIEEANGSYEEFLRIRQSENGSNSSADSGQFSGDESNQMFLQSQPKQMRAKHKDDKPHSVWQKLTWKFRRHVGGYQMS